MPDFASSASTPLATPAGAAAPTLRRLGRFELRALIGRSRRAMAWRAFHPQAQAERVLVMPRQPPADARTLADWQARARRGALVHPMLLPVHEVGIEAQRPYIAYKLPAGAQLWAARPAARDSEATADLARWSRDAAIALAFAHDAGHAHRDLQPWLLVPHDNGELALIGLEASLPCERDRDAAARLKRGAAGARFGPRRATAGSRLRRVRSTTAR